MPINAYTGLMGSGKSFEVVSTVILDALAKGRNVVTNVDGIDSDACRSYLVDKRGLELDKLGVVRHCSNDDVLKADFLPHGTDVDTLVKPGELVCIDEAWRFWGSDSKILPEHYIFFREHRHYADPVTKVTCDLVVMVQDINDLNRKLKAVVELSFRTTKIKSLGMTKTYRVEMWEGFKLAAKNRVAVDVKKYNPDIFPLYSSYQGGQGQEVQVDKRQNILSRKRTWVVMVLTLVGLVVGGWWAMRFFTEPQRKADQAKGAAAPSTAASSPKPGQPATSAVLPSGAAPAVDRIVGRYTVRGETFVLLSSGGVYRPESPSMLKREGLLEVISEGDRLTRRFDFTPTNRSK